MAVQRLAVRTYRERSLRQTLDDGYRTVTLAAPTDCGCRSRPTDERGDAASR